MAMVTPFIMYFLWVSYPTLSTSALDLFDFNVE